MNILIPKNYAKILKKIKQMGGLQKEEENATPYLKKYFRLFDFSVNDTYAIFNKFHIEYFFFKKNNPSKLLSSYSDKIEIEYCNEVGSFFSIFSKKDVRSAVLYYLVEKYMRIEIQSEDRVKITPVDESWSVFFLTLNFFLEEFAEMYGKNFSITIDLSGESDFFISKTGLMSTEFYFKKKDIEKEFDRICTKNSNAYSPKTIEELSIIITNFDEKIYLNQSLKKISNLLKKRLILKIKKNPFFKNQMLLLVEKDDPFLKFLK